MKTRNSMHGASVLMLALFVLLALGSGTAEKAVKETVETHFERGKEFEEKGDWYSAFREYTEAIELNPNFADAYSQRALVRYNMSADYNIRRDAEADCNKAIALDPQKNSPYFYRGMIYRDWGDAELQTIRFGYITSAALTKAVEYYDRALADLNKALELTTNPNNQQRVAAEIATTKAKKEEAETALAASKAKEEANRYDPAKFIVAPSNFKPADYTSIDLFKAVSDSKNLQRVANKLEALNGQMQSAFMLGMGGSYILMYKSDLTFVRQNGTDITFSSDDNAITQNMTIDQRSGLQTGQKVRVYYEVTRSPLITWDVLAIERR